jgi:hypothetical protein
MKKNKEKNSGGEGGGFVFSHGRKKERKKGKKIKRLTTSTLQPGPRSSSAKERKTRRKGRQGAPWGARAGAWRQR